MGKNIVKGIKKYVPIFQEAKENDLKEADVVTRIMKFLEDVFGYDVIEDISKEFQVKDRFVDLAIKIDNKVKFYIEAKSANASLKESQIFQAESYASQSGIEWVVLTNGAEWHLYHLVFDKTGIEHTLVFRVDLINGEIAKNAESLYYLSYESMKNKDIDKFWEKYITLNAGSIIKALFHEDSLNAIRREIRRKSDIRVDEDEILESIKKLLSKDVLTQYGDIIKIGRRRRSATREKQDDQEAPNAINVIKPLESLANGVVNAIKVNPEV